MKFMYERLKCFKQKFSFSQIAQHIFLCWFLSNQCFISIFIRTPASVPVEMKCSTPQQQPPQILQHSYESLNSNASSSGIVDNSNIMTPINPTPILQTNMNVSSPIDNNKSPNITSTGNSNTNAVVCGTCLQPICDRYILKVADSSYHEKCLQCNSCYCTLTNTCYQRDNQLFCKKDYERWEIYWKSRDGISSKIS